jgi:hypothetical protein
VPTGEAGRGPSAAQHRRMHVLWRLAGVTSRADRLALTAVLVRRPLVTSNDLTEHEAWSLITYMTELDRHGRLRSMAQGWLAAHRKESHG